MILLALLCLALGAARAEPLPSVELPPALDRVLRDYELAWRAGNAQALAELFAEDGFVLARGRSPVHGRAAIQAHYRGSGGPLALRALDYSMSGGTAYIIGAYGLTRGGEDIGKFTLTLRQADGGHWLIVSDMDNGNASPSQGQAMPKDLKINYLELPASDLEAIKKFYAACFDWKFTDYGPEYCSFTDDTIDGGFYKAATRSRRDDGGALIVLYAADLEGIRDVVAANGGEILADIFDFPGGRRFHFADPNGNELAVWSDK